jgi:para-nitrobenzyl esterase
VALQYRLGALGWLDLEPLGHEQSPNNALLVSPQADGLFHRAIMQSGSPGLIATKTWSARVHHDFAKHVKADSVDDLRELTTEQILEAQARLFKSRFSDTAFHPVIDGDVVPEVPISFIQPWLNAITGNRADHIIEAYRQSHPGYTDSQIGLAIAGDSAFRMPAIATAEALVNSNTPVWMYLFTLASTSMGGRLGSPHAIDLPFTFNNLRASGASAFIKPDAADYQPLADTIQDAWINFIRHGDPQTTKLGDWPIYDATRPGATFPSTG